MPERDAHGRFLPGHRNVSPGRAPRSREERYLHALHSNVTIQDWIDIIKAAVVKAKNGDDVARKWLSDWLLGLPVQSMKQELDVGGALAKILAGLASQGGPADDEPSTV